MSILPMVVFARNRPADGPPPGAAGPPISGLNLNRTILDGGCCPKLNGGRSAPSERTVRT